MANIRVCDRCKKPIPSFNDWLQDNLDKIYFPRDICPDCDLIIIMRQAIARDSCISGKSEQEIVQEWLNIYE